MTQTPPGAVTHDYNHTLYHNDLGALPPGVLALPDPDLSEHCALPAAQLPGGLRVPLVHPSWKKDGAFKVIERGVNRFIEALGASPFCEERMIVAGDATWSDYRVRAVVTPLNFDGAGASGGHCGLIARYRDPRNFLALLLDRDFHVKLLQRVEGVWQLLDCLPLEFCLGQSLTLTLTLQGARVHAMAGPYTGAVHLYGYMSGHAAPTGVEVWSGGLKGGKPLDLPEQPASHVQFNGGVGFFADVPARLGTVTVETTAEEALAVEARRAALESSRATLQKRFPAMKRLYTVPLHGLGGGPNLRVADVNGDGKPEVIVAQHSPKIVGATSMSRLSCVTVLDLNGTVLWQAGVPDPGAPLFGGDLPADVFDLYHDGHGVVVCVFGFDVQIRDGKTGRILNSAQTPDMTHWTMPADYRDMTLPVGERWGDERENLNVARVLSARILGNGNPDDIVVTGDRHHLVALDGINLKPLFKHRGNHGRSVSALDLNGDGFDELLAGAVLLDHDGATRAKIPMGDAPAASQLVRMSANDDAPRAWAVAGAQGLALLPVGENGWPLPVAEPQFSGAAIEQLCTGRFRSDSPGMQFAAYGAGVLQFFEAGGKRLSTHALGLNGVALKDMKWPGAEHALLLTSMAPGGGLFNGRGQCAVPAPADGPTHFCTVSERFKNDAATVILAWDAQSLAVYAPA
jgi:hypothetical protein